MRIILRNLFTTLRRFRLASFLNIIGLAVAFAAFLVIMAELRYDFTYNTCYKNYKQLYRLEVSSDSLEYNVVVGRNWERFIREGFPQVETMSLRMEYATLGEYIQVERNGELLGFSEQGHLVSPNFPQVFDFTMSEGNSNALFTPGCVLIPRSMAEKWWPGESAMGKKITFADQDSTLIVNGVYKDLPENGMVRNVIYYPIHPDKWSPWDGWNYNYQMFITLKPGTDKAQLEKLIYDYVQRMDVPSWIKDYKVIRLMPIQDIYFDTLVTFDSADKGNRTTSALMLVIALLIIGIATVNYINFATSLTPLRIKSINTQKVLGNPLGTIRLTLLAEAIGISLMAYGISLLIIWHLWLAGFTSLLNANLAFSENGMLFLLGAVFAFAVGALAGIYPAFYSTSLPPALALKGSFGMSSSGRRIRISLISFQFMISFILIIGALFLNLQNRFVRNMDLGYQGNEVLVADLGRLLLSEDKFNLFKNKMAENPQVKQISQTQFQFGTGGAQRNGFYQGENLAMFDYLPVAVGLLKTLRIQLKDGRDFYEEDTRTPGDKLIINDAAAQKYGLKVGEVIPMGTIVGIMENIHFKSLHHSNMDPLMFAVFGQGRRMVLPFTYITVTGDSQNAVEHLKKCVMEIDPAYPLSVSFFDEVFATVYERDRKVVDLITIFSLIAVILSIMGVFGMVVFEAQYRRKEIAVRRIMGSTISGLLWMFNQKYIRITVVCFVIACPVAYYGVVRWLDAFQYRTPVYAWVFLFAFLLVLLITVLTVTSQLWRTANENPARSLKSE